MNKKLEEKNIEEKEKNEENYTSLVDEFRRQKVVYANRKIKADSIDDVWIALEKTIARTFKIKRELKKDIEFGMKIRGIYTKYILEEHDKDKYEIVIFWLNAKDKYWLHYRIVPSMFKGSFKIKFKEIVHREQTFFGLADASGLFILKHSFRKNANMFIKSMKVILDSNEIDNDELIN
ncbi:MAG: hypothetical protein ACRC63_02845 [Metamycoplasmataceae bacterium]